MDFLNKLAKSLQQSLEKWLQEAEAKAKKQASDEPVQEAENPFETFERIEKKVLEKPFPSPDKKSPTTQKIELDDETFEKELLELKKKLNEK